MKLYEEFKLFENMWDKPTLQETKAGMPTPEEYFKQITSSLEAISNFVIKEWAPYALAKARFDLSSSYSTALAKVTNGNHIEIGKNSQYNYKAFLRNISSAYGITKKDLINLMKTGTLVITGQPHSEPVNTTSVPSASPEVSQEVKLKFHRQNIRILLLLDKYTDLRREDLFDILDQLDNNRLKNPSQSEQDFLGI